MLSLKKNSRISLRWRVIFSIILLLVIIVGTFSFLTVSSIHKLIEELMWESYSSYARSFAALSAKSFAERDMNELQRHLDVAFAQPDVIFVVAKSLDGDILAQSENSEEYHPLEVHKNIFEDRAIQVQEIGDRPQGLFHSSGHNFLITARVSFENQDIGSIQLAVDTASANQRLARISLWGFKMALIVVALGTIILIFVDRQLQKNIVRLIQITRSMASGDLSQRVEIKTGDEIEDLGESFNMMAEAIKEREEEIITTRKKYENLFEESAIPTFVSGRAGHILDVNKAGEALVGYSKDELLKLSISRFAKNAEHLSLLLRQITDERKNIRNFELEIVNKQGQTMVVETNAGPIFDESGKLISVISTFKDITQQKHLERQVQKYTEQLEEQVNLRTKELEDEKNKLQLILDNVPSAFIMLDKDLRVQSVSAQFETVLNQQRNEVLGKTSALSDLLYESESQCPSRKALLSGEVQLREAHITTPSGEDKFIEHMAIPIKRNGKIERILEIVTDVTDRKRFEEQLVRTEKLSATGEMAAIIAHEMRNSLSSVNLILQCLTDSVGENDVDAKSLEVAIASVNRMETIVRQLLEFAKPSEINFQSANVNQLIEQSLTFCRYQLQRKQIQLQKKLDTDLPSFELDVEMIREALINILLNATDAVQENGLISVESGLMTIKNTLKDQYDHKSIALKKGQKVIKIKVMDNGLGIAPEDLKRIFDPFFTSKIQGTGLGLTMAKRAVGEHGGILFVESAVGQGSAFTILLPLEPTSNKNSIKGVRL
jgi:PAS domain S-box-containing protein